MATLATQNLLGNGVLSFTGGIGVNDNDVVVQTEDVSGYREFSLQSTAGAMDVLVTTDGTHYTTAPLSLIDRGATTSDPVIVTAANRSYAFFGTFRKVKVLQNGATAVTGACLLCSK